MVLLEDIQVDDRLNYIERLVAVLDRKMKTLTNKVVDMIKVQWQHHEGSEWTWEPEDKMGEHYPKLFGVAVFEDEVLFKWGRILTSGILRY